MGRRRGPERRNGQKPEREIGNLGARRSFRAAELRSDSSRGARLISIERRAMSMFDPCRAMHGDFRRAAAAYTGDSAARRSMRSTAKTQEFLNMVSWMAVVSRGDDGRT